jgi:hypothetical protein
VIYLADENFQRQAVQLLKAFDQKITIRYLTDEFGRGVKDIDWLASAGRMEPKPVILSGDGQILKNRVEKSTFRQAELIYVLLAPGWIHLEWREFAWKIVKAWPDIVKSTQRVARPSVFEVKVGSLKVSLISQTARL